MGSFEEPQALLPMEGISEIPGKREKPRPRKGRCDGRPNPAFTPIRSRSRAMQFSCVWRKASPWVSLGSKCTEVYDPPMRRQGSTRQTGTGKTDVLALPDGWILFRSSG